MGLFDVRLRWKRIHFTARDAGNCHGEFRFLSSMCQKYHLIFIFAHFVGDLQNGRQRHEDA